jgi:hypothetical protein
LLGAFAVALVVVCGSEVRVSAQHAPGQVHGPAAAGATPAVEAPASAPSSAQPRRIKEEELHRNAGVPRGWRFSVPAGDAQRGRELFRELECFKCHEIKTEQFPRPSDDKHPGPELTGMGRIHPREYIAESILFPNAVIVDEPGATGPDGLSLMPSYADSLSVTQWLDLVAYLKGLTEGGEHPEGHGIERVTTAGEYRIRVVYTDGGHAGHGEHTGPPGSRRPAGHLMAFITEQETGEAVAYLPVTATVQAPGTARRTITLRPMMGDGGFHYGADVLLPSQTTKLTLVVGPTTVRVLGEAKGRFSKPARAVFDWSTPAK